MSEANEIRSLPGGLVVVNTPMTKYEQAVLNGLATIAGLLSNVNRQNDILIRLATGVVTKKELKTTIEEIDKMQNAIVTAKEGA